MEAGEYEVLVVLAGAEEPVRAPLTFSNHRLGTQAGRTCSRSEIYDDDGR